MKHSTNSYLEKAKKYYNIAKEELIKAKQENNISRAQQAAEKGYLSLLRTLDALFTKYGEKRLPRVERGRLYCLRKYADRDFRRKYHSIRHTLHIDAFHNEIIDYEILEESFDDLASLIKVVEIK